MLQTLIDIKDFLLENLEEAKNEIAIKYNLVVPKWLYLDRYRPPNANQFPAISITPNKTGEQNPIAGNTGNSLLVQRLEDIYVAVWHRGNNNDSQHIEDVILVYTDALNNLFQKNINLGLGANGNERKRRYRFVKITDTSYVDFFRSELDGPNTLRLAAILSIEVQLNY